MKLEEMTWYEVQTYLQESRGIILPTGSVEQHGPLGLIGTDSICAREIAWAAAERCGAIVAPEISYSPAPFNMSCVAYTCGLRECSQKRFDELGPSWV